MGTPTISDGIHQQEAVSILYVLIPHSAEYILKQRRMSSLVKHRLHSACVGEGYRIMLIPASCNCVPIVLIMKNNCFGVNSFAPDRAKYLKECAREVMPTFEKFTYISSRIDNFNFDGAAIYFNICLVIVFYQKIKSSS